jgi:signal transduction histidine kinase
MSQPQKTKAQLLDEVTILRQQMAELVHDIKDPLGVILGYTGMLLQEASTRETVQRTEALERIHCNALRICSLLTRSVDL